MTHDNPFMPPREAVQWDCTECGAGLWLTELAAAKGCPVDHPEMCGGKLVKRAGVVRTCRLDEDECARRCTGKPSGCDTYGEGLTPDMRGCYVAGREVIDGVVHLDLQPMPEGGGHMSAPGRTPDPAKYEPTAINLIGGQRVYRKFTSRQHWIDKAPTWMGPGTVCVDSGGCELAHGSDFDGATYPVFVARKIREGGGS